MQAMNQQSGVRPAVTTALSKTKLCRCGCYETTSVQVVLFDTIRQPLDSSIASTSLISWKLLGS